MDEATSTLLVGLIGLLGVVITSLVAYRQGQLKVQQELQIEYDKDLRERRIAHYLELWSLLAPLAKYPRPAELNGEDVEKLATACKRWYFGGGGLFLSSRTREHYFDLLDGCRIILEKRVGNWTVAPADPALREQLGRAAGWRPPDALRMIATTPLDAHDELLPDTSTAALRSLGSALRTSMANDVLARRETALRAGASATDEG